MRRFGGLHPFPWGSRNEIEIFRDTILDGLGTGINRDGYAQAHAMASARIFFEARIGGESLAYQWQPMKTLELAAWEKIFGLTQNALLPTSQRRQLLALKWRMIGLPCNIGNLLASLSSILGLQFVQLQHTTQAESVADGTAMILGGLDLTSHGGANFPDGNEEDQASSTDFHQQWSNKNTFPDRIATSLVGRSAVAHVAVQVTKYDGLSDLQYWQGIDIASNFLDSILPAWTTFGFVRNVQTFHVDGYASEGFVNLDISPLGPSS